MASLVLIAWMVVVMLASFVARITTSRRSEHQEAARRAAIRQRQIQAEIDTLRTVQQTVAEMFDAIRNQD